jgi:hypothetical protein
VRVSSIEDRSARGKLRSCKSRALAACRTEVFSQALRSAVTGLAEPADLAFSW